MASEEVIFFLYYDLRVHITICLNYVQCCFGLLFGTSDSLFLSLCVTLVCCLCWVREISLDCPRCEAGPCWNFIIYYFLQDCLCRSSKYWLVEVFDEFWFKCHGMYVVWHVFDLDRLCLCRCLVEFLNWKHPWSRLWLLSSLPYYFSIIIHTTYVFIVL